jgi:8-oxo-dGTP pyrophosphatase MutT (NUDIX family)
MDTSFKAVVFDEHGRVLLGKNPREEWELLGGRADPGDISPEDTIRRELLEETGIEVSLGPLIDIWFYDVAGGRIAVASYLASIATGTKAPSIEHSELAFFDADELDGLNLPAGYKMSIRRARKLL